MVDRHQMATIQAANGRRRLGIFLGSEPGLTRRHHFISFHGLLSNTVHRFVCSAVFLIAAAVVCSTGVSAAQVPPSPTVAPAPPGAPQMVKLQYPNSDVQDVLHLYEQLTGKKLVTDNFVQGKVNIFVPGTVPREEAIKIIEINLQMNGYSLVPSEGDIVKVFGTGKNPRSGGVPIISDQSEIPPDGRIISFLFKLRYADPQELQQVLGQYLSPPQPYTSFLALPKSGSLLITEDSSVIRTIAHIINQVDVPPAEVVSEFIQLERADASKVVDMLKEIFEKEDKTGTAGQPRYRGVRNVRSPGGLPIPGAQEENEAGALTALTEESVIVGKIKLEADVRTNRIHVITRPINMPFVRKLIAEFDANVEFAKPVVRPLEYIAAGDVLPVIVQALSEPGTNAQGGAEGGGGATPQPQLQRTPNPTGQYGNTGLSGNTGNESGGALNISDELQTQPVDTTPKAVTVGNAKIIADQRSNSIIILGNRDVVVKVEKLLDDMDVQAPQVALSTVIGELTLNNDEEFGVDYFFRQHRGVGVAGTIKNTNVPPHAGGGVLDTTASPPTNINGTIFDPANLIGFTQLAQSAANGTNVYLAAGETLAAVVHALDSTGKFKVISRPMVFTSNNKKAIIASGQEVPIPVNTLTNVVPTTANGTAAVASNIEYKSVALQLEVVPLINSQKEVSLDILQKIDSLVSGANVNIGGNSVPTIATRYIRSNVTAKSGSTIVLGGLIQDSKSKSVNGIPILDKIPYVGAAFRNTTYTRMRTELIILMCPEVTGDELALHRLRRKAEENTHFGPEIDQGDCPDCPPQTNEGKDAGQLPPPDLPGVKNVIKKQ
jgi:general secretion pathway protein D